METTPENKTDKLAKKELNVKRIFFYEGEIIPSFELEDGTIKRAYFNYTKQGTTTLWYTEAEVQEKKEAIKASQNKVKILDKDGRKIGN